MSLFANFAPYTSSGAATASHSFALTLGSGVKRKILIAIIHDETAVTFSAVAFASGVGGGAATLVTNGERVFGGTYTAGGVHFHFYDVPDALAAGNYNVTFTTSGSTSLYSAKAWQLVNAATGQPEDADYGEKDTTSATVTTQAQITCTQDAFLAAAALCTAATPTWDSYAAAIAERATGEGNEANYTSTAADGDQAAAGAKTVSATASSTSGNKVIVAISVAAVASSSAAVTGTGAAGVSGDQVRTNGAKTLVYTLTGDTFSATDAAAKQAIIDSWVAASSPTWGWNNTRASIPTSAVVFTGNDVATFTIPALPGYQSDANEVLTGTIPGSILTLGAAIVASPTVTISKTSTDLTPVDDYAMTGTATRTRP